MRGVWRDWGAALSGPGNLAVFAAVVACGVTQIAVGPLDPRLWAGLFAAYFLLNVAALRVSGLLLLVASLLAAGAGARLGVPLGGGVAQASFLFAFLLILQYMGRLVSRSPDVARGAELIVSQPPGRRYAFFTFGTHLLSVFLQLGGLIIVIGLLASRLASESAATVRSLAAGALRGFAVTAMWSPLSLSVLITFSGVSGVSYLAFAPVGAAVALVYLLAGLWFERGRSAGPAAARALGPEELRLVGRLAAPVVVLIVTGLSLVAALNLRLIEGVLLAVLAMALLWTAAQARSGLAALAGPARESARGIANEVAIICGAVMIGTLAADLAREAGALQTALTPARAAVTAGLVPLLIFAGGLVALNPLVTVTFLVGVLDAVWPTGAGLWLALALTGGWTVTACGTPFTASMLLTAQQLGAPGHRLAFAWNGHFTALTMAVLCPALAVGAWLAAL